MFSQRYSSFRFLPFKPEQESKEPFVVSLRLPSHRSRSSCACQQVTYSEQPVKQPNKNFSNSKKDFTEQR